MPIDPTADIGRKAWFDCPQCAYEWQYLLRSKVFLLDLQCPSCALLWQQNTKD